MIINGRGVFAICPACERRKELFAVPAPGEPWPYCEDCGEPMNVFAPSSTHRTRQVHAFKASA